MDLVAWLDGSPEFCHLLLAGETGTGKTTFAISLLRLFLTRNSDIGVNDMLIIDPKYSQWAGLFRTGIYQPAFSGKQHDLSDSVDRLEAFFYKIERRAIERQRTGERAISSCLVIVDEVNTYLDALKSMDNLLMAQNKGVKPQDKTEPLNLHQRACIAIAGLGRMGREDRVCLWLLGQNPNLKALGFEGASDRANFSVVSVGFRANQVALAVALSNPSMFPLGQKLVGELEAHESATYQLAACSRLPKNLLIMPSSYVQTGSGDLDTATLGRFMGRTVPPVAQPSQPVYAAPPNPWDDREEATIAPTPTRQPVEIAASVASRVSASSSSTATKRPTTVASAVERQLDNSSDFHPTKWVLSRVREDGEEGTKFSELWADAEKTPIKKQMNRERFQQWMTGLINKGTLKVEQGYLFVVENNWWDL
jgi:DNA polymerase III delta prime subunit